MEEDWAEEAARLLAATRGTALGHPVRLAAMILLAARGCLEFATLQRLLEVPPGSLWGHIERLEKEGLAERKRRLTILGPRLQVCPTGKGLRKTLGLLYKLRGGAE